MVPDGVEEVELARIKLEHKERDQKMLLDDIVKLSLGNDTSGKLVPEKEGELWMISGGKSTLVRYQIPSTSSTIILSYLLMLPRCSVS